MARTSNRSSERQSVSVCVGERERALTGEWETAISQSAKQEGVWVQQRPGCVETLWSCPAPEVWTDGFGGVHRKVFRESIVLMFMASWPYCWGAASRDDQRKCMGTWWKQKICLCPCWWCEGGNALFFCIYLFFSCLPCWTAGLHYKKKAIMICLTEPSSKIPPTKWVSCTKEGSDTSQVRAIQGDMWVPRQFIVLWTSIIQSVIVRHKLTPLTENMDRIKKIISIGVNAMAIP